MDGAFFLIVLIVVAAFTAIAVIRAWRRRNAKRRQSAIGNPVAWPPPTLSPQASMPPPIHQLSQPVMPPAHSQPTPGPSGVFISYRRDDESNFAGRLFERLLRNFATDRIFMDVDSIELGMDFQEVIDGWLERCSVVLVVIGNKWLDCKAPDGSRRLDNPDDFVRIEVASALARPGVRVIPVLVDGASVPNATDLPDPLKPLARRNALTMSHAGFGSDFDRLHSTLQRVV
jgi:TIR domain